MEARIVTKWNAKGNDLTIDAEKFLRAGDSLMDVTGEITPVESPIVVVEIWSSDGAAIQAVADDPQYGEAAIFSAWEEKNG